MPGVLNLFPVEYPKS